MNPRTGEWIEADKIEEELIAEFKLQGRTVVPEDWPRLGIHDIVKVETTDGRILKMQVWEIKGRKVVMRSLPTS